MKVCTACSRFCKGEADICEICGQRICLENGISIFAPEVDQTDGYDPSYFTLLAELESKNFWFQQRNGIILDAISRYFKSAIKYLEIGCGTGFVLRGIQSRFPDWVIVGSELHSEGLRYATERVPDGCFLQMDARKIPFSLEFDLVGSFDVLEHIDDDTGVMRSVFDALKPGGGFIVTVPQHMFLWSQQDELAHHVRRYEPGEMERKLRQAGFDILRSSSFVTLLLPAMMLSRRTSKINNISIDPVRELKLGKFVNSLGRLLMGVDRHLMKLGFNLPIGGSRIVIARKPLQ